MLERFKAHLESTALIPSGDSVLVAYSGGADSTCLLHLLKRAGVDIVAAHLHHGQRPEADGEMESCQAFCDTLGVPFLGGRADVPKLSQDLKIGLEEGGRIARYNFLENGASQTNCQWIATAHTQTDHVETVLLHLSRGSGLTGLAGIPAKRDQVIRPLLCFTRAETLQYCLENELWFHNDPANTDLTFSRARVRHRIVPEFESINPRFGDAVTRFASIVAEEDSFLTGAAAAGLEHAEIALNGPFHFLTKDCEVGLRRDVLLALPPVLLKRGIRLAVKTMGADLTFDQVQDVVDGLGQEPTGSVTAEGGRIVLEWNQDRIHIRDLTPDVPYRYPLTIPGETISDHFGWQFVAFVSDRTPEKPERASFETCLDEQSIKGSLYFRTVQPGDRIQPLGFDGHRKVNDLLSDAKLTSAAKARIPVVCDLVGPLWIPGICVDQRTQAEHSSRVVRVRFESLQA